VSLSGARKPKTPGQLGRISAPVPDRVTAVGWKPELPGVRIVSLLDLILLF
jgi:hypothetical protein